jgi:hypothetical protein
VTPYNVTSYNVTSYHKTLKYITICHMSPCCVAIRLVIFYHMRLGYVTPYRKTQIWQGRLASLPYFSEKHVVSAPCAVKADGTTLELSQSVMKQAVKSLRHS